MQVKPATAQNSRLLNIIKNTSDRLANSMADSPKHVLLMPAILIVLFLSIFPLLVSLYLSFAQVNFVKGAVNIQFVGLRNYASLLTGGEQRHFLGKLGALSPAGWLVFVLFVGFMLYLMLRYLGSPRRRIGGIISRIFTIAFAGGLVYLCLSTLSETGLPGTLVVTLIFVFAGVFFQYVIGLGLAMLVTQNLPGKRIFRIVFLLPMMITPVGIGFLFRMMTDTHIGPISPLWVQLGLSNTSWAATAFGARAAVIIGDVWQWTPFMFIILLAACEAVSQEQIEAALVDGANRLELFRFIVIPQILPISTTVVLIRLIEAFKIIDMPNILTGGGPGTGTESMTLHAYKLWQSGTSGIGMSAAIAYLLLVVVTFVAVVYTNSVRRRLVQD
jgi:multiple sugar transport system permease protein